LPPELTVVGSQNLDLVVRVEHLPRPGETVTDGEFARVPGGKGANQAVAAARLGAEVTFLGYRGNDELGDQLSAALVSDGVHDLSLVSTEPTGVALIIVDAAGENQIAVAPGANTVLRTDYVEGYLDGGPVLCQLEIPLEAVVAAASKADFFCLNAAPAKPVPPELVDRADLLVVNRYELDALPKQPRFVALTLGEEGAVLLENGEEIAQAAPPPVRAVDGTAAGDAFTACLVVSHLEGRAWDEALRRACAAGAIAASRPGAQPSLPTAAEVDEILG
jgi:ribokinase